MHLYNSLIDTSYIYYYTHIYAYMYVYGMLFSNCLKHGYSSFCAAKKGANIFYISFLTKS